MKKVTYIIDNLRIGGAQMHLLKLASALRDRDYSVEIVCLGALGKNQNNYSDNLIIHNIKMDCIWKLYFWKNFLKLIQLLVKTKPAIVHTYLNTSNVFGFLAAKIAQVPTIITSRRDMGHFRSRIIGSLEKITAKLSNKVVCVSQSVRNNVIKKEGLNFDKTAVIYNGVDTNIFAKKNGKGQRGYINISMVAAMDRREKGHSYFIEATILALEKRKDLRFTLIGDGPLRPSLEQYVNSKKVAKYFDFKGKLNDIHEELKKTDIFIVPSESEGCSNALLEAMSMGIPVIATAVEGNLEIIEDKVSGYLVQPKEPSQITEKILSLIDSSKEMKRLSINSRKSILEKFTLEDMVKNYINLYKGLAEKKRLKVGYIVSLFPCWSETFILNEIIELEKQGIDVSIFSIRKDLEKLIQEKAKRYMNKAKYINTAGLIKSTLAWIIKKPITTFSISWMVLSRKPMNIKKLFKNLWSIFVSFYFADIAIKENIQHIHAHFASYPALSAMVMSKLTSKPFTFTCHAHDIFLDKCLLKDKAGAAKGIMAISEYNKKYITEFCGCKIASKIKVIHCGLNLSEYSCIERKNNNKYTILSIGRLTKMKGFEYLIKACKKIEGKLKFYCYIVGDGPLRDKLQKLINDCGLNKNIFLTGALDNIEIKELFKKADIFALPCVNDKEDGQDGIPVVLMEAMASGIPVISSNISGIPELIENGKSGFLVEPGNTNELSGRLIELLKNKELQKRFSLNGRLKIEKDFNISKNAGSLRAIFEEIQEKTNPAVIKSLFVIWSLERGGAERFLVSLLKTIDKNKIAPTVCCLNWKGKWASELENIGVEVIALNKKGKFDLNAFINLVKIIKKGKYHVVNTYLWGADVIGRLAAFFAGTPIVISTAQNADMWKKWWHRMTDRLLSHKTDSIIAVSDAVKEYYHREIGIPLSKINCIPNAIEIDRFNNIGNTAYLYDELGLTAKNFILTCIARLTHQKGQEYLLKSIKKLSNEYPHLRVIFVGDGEDREKLINMAKALDVYKIVRFVGYRNDIPEILQISDALVLPSLYEGLPLCALEAMAVAKPVIATRVGGVEEIVINNKTGFIIPPRDMEALAQAIKNIIKLPDKGKRMGERGRDIVVNNYSIQSIAQKTTDLFLSLAGEKR